MAKNSSTLEDGVTVFGVLILIVIAVVVMPFVSFWLAYFGGWITMKVIGNTLCTALNTCFGTSRFEPRMIPWVAGALGWIGGYFKSSAVLKNRN